MPIAQFQRIRWDKNDEGELRFWSTTAMNNPKSWIKALRIAAAVLVMVAQVIVACLG